ncbi:MAG: PPOX class F420-dependent oxidoreductase, partial [Actinobacteria bacterium]|nr:PPOX class F420-dependent oxidoreductase [Actinomycetota bacterium]
LWAFFAPRSFFDAVAVFQPYNEHFVHDIGAFQIGLGAVLVLGAYLADALFVALAGVGMGATLHLISHVMDRDLGGNPSSDIPLLAVMTGALVAGAIVRGKGARP